MSTFTLALKEVLDVRHDLGNGYRVGLSDYPIWKPEYRDPLNQKIINHFWNREIAHESISIFEHNLKRKMWEIMPLYNQVYHSTEIQFDPLATFDLSTTRQESGTETGAATTTSASTGATTSASRTTNSEMPQTQLSEDEDYATSGTDANAATQSNNNGQGQSNSSNNSQNNGNSRTTGFQGSAADLLLKYRATLLNVDMMIIGELNELFMGVYSNGDELLPQRNGYYL